MHLSSDQTGISASISQPSWSALRPFGKRLQTQHRRGEISLIGCIQPSYIDPGRSSRMSTGQCCPACVDRAMMMPLRTTLDFVQMSSVAMFRSYVGIDVFVPMGCQLNSLISIAERYSSKSARITFVNWVGCLHTIWSRPKKPSSSRPFECPGHWLMIIDLNLSLRVQEIQFLT